MSITIHCPFHNQHNLSNFPLDSSLPKPPNSTVHLLLFPSPKFHNLSLSPNPKTHPCHNLTIRCLLPNLHQFHHQLTNLFQISIIQLSTPKILLFPIIQLSTLYLSLPSSNCPLSTSPSNHPTVHSLTSPSHHPTVHSLSLPSIVPLSTLYASLLSVNCPLSNLSLAWP